MTQQNPLQQYFRRPALYITLPSKGLGYSKTALEMTENGELPVYPMTTIDEISSKTPDALYSGQAVVDIIHSCVPAFKNAWEIKSIDLDTVLIAIRAATNGNEMDTESTCPSCGETSKYGLNLVGLLANFKAGDYHKPLVIGEIKIKFKPVTFKEHNKGNMAQFELQRMLGQIREATTDEEQMKLSGDTVRKVSILTMNIVCDGIEFIEAPDGSIVTDKSFILEFLQNCERKVYDKIRDTNADLKTNTETKPLKFTCVDCSHEYEQPFTLNVSDFFD
jgi:hypothetical protein